MLLYRNDAKWFDLAFNPTAWLGNTFTGAGAGLQFRLGHFGSFSESAMTNSRVSSDPAEHMGHEFFFFTTPRKLIT